MKAAASPIPNGHAPATAVVARPRSKPLKPSLPPQPNSLLEAIIYAASDPSIDIAKVEHLIRLRKEMEAVEAERLFNDAMATVQSELTPIVADAVNDQTSSKYATYAALDRVVRPVYTAHGFALTFTAGERSTDVAVEIVAFLTGHGHGRRYTVTMPADGLGPKGSPVMSRTHAASSACTYGMRRLLTMIFNLAIDKDDDGNAAGSKPASSASLKRSGVWSEFERDMRAAPSLPALEAVCDRWRPRMLNWSAGYKTAAVELKGQQIERLGGTLAQLQESAGQIEQDERYQQALEEDAAERRYELNRRRY
jgi:hypothetical protein